MRPRPFLRFLASIACLACLAGAAGARGGEGGADGGAADLQARLRALSAAASCTADSDCRTVPMGAKACGGPAGWLPVQAGQYAEAAELAARYAELRRAELAAQPAQQSDCRAVPDPGASCRAGQCTLRQRGAGNRVD